MKIAIVGPTHPYKGGIAQQTTQLANELSDPGNDVHLISWKHQFPFFYPGDQFVQQDDPEVPTFSDAKRILSWRNPIGWWRLGRKLKDFDQIILIWWVPTIQGPVYSVLLKGLSTTTAKITIICHNVLPHEGRPGDEKLTKRVFNSVDKIVVHTKAQAEIAKTITDTAIMISDLPLAVPPPMNSESNTKTASRKLLFFGFVRPYKGLDILFEALAKTNAVNLLVAGEFWGGTEKYKHQIEELKLGDRVTLINRYLSTQELAHAIADTDAVVLPYKSGTASQHVAIANYYGSPVIATTAGSFNTQVKPGLNGLLCEPSDVASLASAIKHIYEPGVLESLNRHIAESPVATGWDKYVTDVLR